MLMASDMGQLQKVLIANWKRDQRGCWLPSPSESTFLSRLSTLLARENYQQTNNKQTFQPHPVPCSPFSSYELLSSLPSRCLQLLESLPWWPFSSMVGASVFVTSATLEEELTLLRLDTTFALASSDVLSSNISSVTLRPSLSSSPDCIRTSSASSRLSALAQFLTTVRSASSSASSSSSSISASVSIFFCSSSSA